jgi:hypothetical protein
MSDPSELESRMEALEKKLSAMRPDAVVEPEKGSGHPRHARRSGKVFVGILVLLLGLIWLGQNLDIEWVRDLKFWPLAVIAFGIYLLFER